MPSRNCKGALELFGFSVAQALFNGVAVATAWFLLVLLVLPWRRLGFLLFWGTGVPWFSVGDTYLAKGVSVFGVPLPDQGGERSMVLVYSCVGAGACPGPLVPGAALGPAHGRRLGHGFYKGCPLRSKKVASV